MLWFSCIVSNVFLATLLALVAWIVQRVLRWHAVAHVLWVLVLIKLVTPPLVSVPVGQSPGYVACTLGVCGCDHHSRTQTFVRDGLPWILIAAWSAGAGVVTWTAWRRWTLFRKLTMHARPAPKAWQALAARLGSELSIRRPPEILAVPGRLPPLIVPGWLRPRMLLPAALMSRLNASQRAAILLHELIHIRRRDHWVRTLEMTVGAAYWWLPVVGGIGRQLRACEEACCDAAVVAHLPPPERRNYAELLLDVIDFAGATPGPAVQQATAMSVASDLEERLRMILETAKPPRRWRPARALALGLGCVILPCGMRYDFVRQAAPAAGTILCEPAAGVEQTQSATEGCATPKVYECPS
jgi:beta-lactamase regulating signal transducer with metallopeptidase domain